MPDPALPIARTIDGPTYRRTYVDPLGRPMQGTVTLVGQARTTQGDTVIVPTPVIVELVGGVLSVALPPDTYKVTANLRTADGHKTTDTDTVTLEPHRPTPSYRSRLNEETHT